MKIQFDGAAQTVTGSQYKVEVNGKRLLLECGLFQGRRADFFTRNRTFAYEPSSLDAVILSHAHIDHSGNLPNLVKHGYNGPIFTTPGTAGLADIMLRDSGHIQESDALFINKKRAARGEPPVEPLYTQQDAARVTPHFRPVPYRQTFEPVEGVTAHLVDAGHILGSAAVVLDVKENGRSFRFWFSGDIGRDHLPLIEDPVLPDGVDYLMMECTYGDQPHPSPEQAAADLRDVLDRTIKRGGKVIIPAFAVGRTQELVYEIHRMYDRGDIKRVPVFVDSPLAVAASKIFTQHPEYFDAETQAFIRAGSHPALEFSQLTYISDVEESKKLNDRHEPMIILSASGMAEAGRILHHLKNNIEDSRNTILIVGWQAPDTLGRRLADGDRKVRIFGEEYDRRAEVVTLHGFSAHAGQDKLLEYAAAVKDRVHQVILVHGEPEKEAIFSQKLAEAGLTSQHFPAQGEILEI